MVWTPIVWLVVIVRLMFGLLGQPQPAMLTISLRDVDARGVVGATVLVRDVSGERELARAVTDADGQAAIAFVPLPEIRVAVEGSLADGTPLLLRGNNGLGIRYFLSSEQDTMQLRADIDGTVLPDPGAAIALETAGNAGDLPPEALLAPPHASPTATAPALPTGAGTPHGAQGGEVAAASDVPLWQVVLVTAGALVLGGGAAALALMRERL
jgi:hypothetical protein